MFQLKGRVEKKHRKYETHSPTIFLLSEPKKVTNTFTLVSDVETHIINPINYPKLEKIWLSLESS